MMANRMEPILEECRKVATATFPHVADTRHRMELEQTLVGFACSICELISQMGLSVEARIAGLEKDSHPPVPLRPIIIQEVEDAIRRRQINTLACR